MKVLVTGGAGYLGSSLVSKIKKCHDVTVFDNLMYNQGTLVSGCIVDSLNFGEMPRSSVKFYKEDVNDWSENLVEAIKEADVIVPLAALVGAPLCDRKKSETRKTNYKWFVKLVKLLDDSQLVIYPNTNSGYGSTGEEVCTEETPLNPISLYAKTKQLAEEYLLKNHKKTIVFRLATVFGWSPRPRTDLLVNNLTRVFKEQSHVQVFDGHFRRNYIHVEDIVRAFEFAIFMNKKMVGQAFNLGNDSLNVSKEGLVKQISDFMSSQGYDVSYSQDSSRTDPDKRDYLVSSQKLYDLGYHCTRGIEHGVSEMLRFYDVMCPSDEEKCKNY
jgi:nucleoside-diphosphate-sugar epimerase